MKRRKADSRPLNEEGKKIFFYSFRRNKNFFHERRWEGLNIPGRVVRLPRKEGHHNRGGSRRETPSAVPRHKSVWLWGGCMSAARGKTWRERGIHKIFAKKRGGCQ